MMPSVNGNRIQSRERNTGKHGKASSVPRKQTVAMPEARISRRAKLEGCNNNWREFLEQHGHLNYGDGNTRALGSMAVTYVSAQEMGKMLSVKYPKIFTKDTVGQVRKLINSVHKNFIAFIANEDKTHTAFLSNLDNVEALNRAETDRKYFGYACHDVQSDIENSRVARNKLWVASKFQVVGIEPYGVSNLGVSLSHQENEALRSERQRIVKEFLGRDQKLPVRYIDPNFDPHASFFEANSPVQQLILRSVTPPADLLLDKPEMVVNLKT